MGPLGWQETLFIFVLALLIFGPKKLPELGKTIGKAMTEFRRASSELRSTWDREMAAIERESHEVTSATSSIQNELNASTSDYNSSYYDSNYDYGYGYDTTDSTGASGSTESSTVSATATQGADQPANAAIESASTETVAAAAPEGTVAREKQPEGPQSAEA